MEMHQYARMVVILCLREKISDTKSFCPHKHKEIWTHKRSGEAKAQSTNDNDSPLSDYNMRIFDQPKRKLITLYAHYGDDSRKFTVADVHGVVRACFIRIFGSKTLSSFYKA